MIRYELKKIMSKRMNRLLMLILLALTFVFSYFAMVSSFYVDERGIEQTGIGSVRKLNQDKSRWQGVLTPEIVDRIVRQRQEMEKIYAGNIPNDIYGKELQGYYDIVIMVNGILRADKEFESSAILRMPVEDAKKIYRIREQNIQKIISIYAKSEAQKEFLNKIYQEVKTPFYYEPYESWDILARYTNTLGLIMILLLTIPVSAIFTDEFQTGAEAIFFSTKLGRGKAIASKIGAALILVTAVYWGIMLLFSGINLAVMGISGHSVLYQIDFSYSIYPLTFLQKHFLILGCEYIAALLAASTAMLMAVKTRKNAVAIFVPFLLFAVSPFIAREMPFKTFFQLTPDQLMNINNCLRFYYIYEVGGIVFRQISFLLVFYAVVSLILLPFVYKNYDRHRGKWA